MLTKDGFTFGFKSNAEKLGEEYRKMMRISKFEPLDAYQLARYIKAKVFTIKDVFNDDEGNPAFMHLSNPANFSAMCMPNEDSEKIIIHNPNHTPARQQSNLMHELAHIILEHEIPDGIARLCFQFNLIYFNGLQEKEAKYLGGCLQITRPGLMWAHKNLISVERIAEYYSASSEMVDYRLNIAGVRKQYSYINKD